MNRSTFALFVALLIHLLFILIFWILGTITPDITKTKKPKEEKIKISLKEMPKKEKKSGLIKKKLKQTPIAPPMPKGRQLKKLIKKPPVKFKPKKPVKTPTLNKPKASKPKHKSTPKPKSKKEPKLKPKTEPFLPRKPYIPLKEIKKKKVIKKPQKDNTPAWMLEDKAQEEEKEKTTEFSRFGSGGTTREMKELYGDKWGELTPGQKQYMLDNQEIMRRITQQVLNRVARVNLDKDLNVNKTNVIEFYLHPNGDMTDFKFIKKSGYFVLDNTTKETIEYAYSRYPRPKEKILVRYNVFYNLSRY